MPGLIGKDVDQSGNVAPYPELSAFSFSSADEKSPYSRGFWTHVERKGAYAQQARLAWDRLRHVLSMDLRGPATASRPIRRAALDHHCQHRQRPRLSHRLSRRTHRLAGSPRLRSGHRQRAANPGQCLEARLDRGRKPDNRGDGRSQFPGCNWKIPAGSADPYSMQFKAVASLGDGCPTLDLPYATPLNLVTNNQGLPIDEDGRVIDRNNSRALPQFKDTDGNGDLFDDSFLRDTRFKPRGRPEFEKKIDRYAVVIPPGTKGPVAVSATVYYQSVEAVVALHFLGNMADTNGNFVLEPCVLGGLCDGRKPATEPPVVEGAPPVPMVVRNWVISVDGARWPMQPDCAWLLILMRASAMPIRIPWSKFSSRSPFAAWTTAASFLPILAEYRCRRGLTRSATEPGGFSPTQ